MKIVTLLLILVFSLVLLVFLFLNQGPVSIHYFPGAGYVTPPIPLFAIIMLSIIAGVVMAGVIGAVEQLRLRLRIRQLNRRVVHLERELDSLRRIEVVDGEPIEPGEAIVEGTIEPEPHSASDNS